jgi:hypothetical protein
MFDDRIRLGINDGEVVDTAEAHKDQAGVFCEGTGA